MLRWEEDGRSMESAYASLRAGTAPKRAVAGDDTLTADAALRLVSQGTAIVWRSDFVNGRQLLQALGRRIDGRLKVRSDPATPAASFNSWRQVNAQRANMLSLLLVAVTGGTIELPRAPDAGEALRQAFGDLPDRALMPLRDVLTTISAAEWHRKGVPVAALGASVHPHFGVFPPTRQDYVELVARAPLPEADIAFDLGTGSGVLGAVLLHRGVPRLVATDISAAAIASARETFERLGCADRVELVPDRLYPDGRAPLIVCNPPWLPGKAGTSFESAVYDPDSRMLREFLGGLADHLLSGGEGWLVMSNLAELLGLRQDGELKRWFADAGLDVAGRLDAPPATMGAEATDDPLYFARSKELVALWRLRAR
jgi:hypothetical protein